jgi:hypothetical protein
MDIEQLKPVLQSLDGVTEGAKQIGLGWLALDFIKGLFPFALGFFVTSKAANVIRALIEKNSRMVALRDLAFPDQAGTSVSPHEFKRVQYLLEAGIKNS